MHEIMEQMEPHTYRKNYSIKNIRGSKLIYPLTVIESPLEAILNF